MPDEAPDPGKMSVDELRTQIEHLDGAIEMETGEPGAGQLETTPGVLSTLQFPGLAGRDVDQLQARRKALKAELD